MAGHITFDTRGSLKRTRNFLKRSHMLDMTMLKVYGELGVQALASSTPMDTGKTSASWYYKIVDDGEILTLEWHNSNLSEDWFPIAIYLQYGHATRSGTWVEGIDYINPALRPIFEDLANTMWKEVSK